MTQLAAMSGPELTALHEGIAQARAERERKVYFDPMPDPKPTIADENHDAIAGRVRDYYARLEAIRADTTLSDVGKTELLQDAYEKAQQDVGSMHAASGEIVSDRTTELTRKLFGMTASTSAMDFRNAQDRVGDVRDPHRLIDLMNDAEATGDETLLRAGFAHAWKQSRNPMASDMWDGIVGEYLRQNPMLTDKLDELERLSTPRSRTQEFGRHIETAVVKPKELR